MSANMDQRSGLNLSHIECNEKITKMTKERDLWKQEALAARYYLTWLDDNRPIPCDLAWQAAVEKTKKELGE